MFMLFTQVKTPNQKHIVEYQKMVMTYRELWYMYMYFIPSSQQATENKFLGPHLIFTKRYDLKQKKSVHLPLENLYLDIKLIFLTRKKWM